jgi:hypothetical protein
MPSPKITRVMNIMGIQPLMARSAHNQSSQKKQFKIAASLSSDSGRNHFETAKTLTRHRGVP